MSYLSNCTRIGVLILWYHNVSDVFLQLAKLGKAIHHHKLANGSFFIFAVIFPVRLVSLYIDGSNNIYSRLYFYPRLVLEGVVNADVDDFLVYRILTAFLVVLVFLHIQWSYTIFKIVAKSLSGGEVSDIREENKKSQ